MGLTRSHSSRARVVNAAVPGVAVPDFTTSTPSRWDDSTTMRTDVLALICPDWRLASLVMDGGNGQITYANTPCLQMLAGRSMVQLVAGRIAFASPQLTKKFYATLERMLASGLENAALVEREGRGGALISVMIRNTQGFFRDVLDRSIGRNQDRSQLVVVEFASSRDQSDWAALCAFAQAFSLPPAEVEIADLAVRGLSVKEMADLKGVTVARIRQGMNNVLTKTQCKHQSELVRLLMTLCPPTRRA